ncbi:TPA: cyclic nucleotide-binding/CBS domain-containing protein [Aeromonas sobria]|nr:cyclic nucleotide-binding/CBS domain-containing protein [Aeromonas sobria]HEH9429169.1 cyclic nucleotide-binding/CBS domain-containing protein [Aeromonas sobria]
MSLDQSLLPNICHFLSSTDPFDLLRESELKLLAGQIEISYWSAGEVLPGERIVGKGLFVVRTGALEQRYSDQSLRARLGSGDLFGFSQLEREGDCDYQVIAIEPALIYGIPKPVLYEVMEQNFSLKEHFSEAEHRRLASGQQRDRPSDEVLFSLQPVSVMVNRQMAVVSPETSIHETAKVMVGEHRSSALIMEGGTLLGIVTDRDMTKRVIAQGLQYDQPIRLVMSCNPCTIDSNAPLIQAMELMMHHNVRSLPVIEQGRICGVLTATSLVQRNQAQAVFLISRIYRQESVAGLQTLCAQRQALFEALVEGGVQAGRIAQIMTLIADAITRRLLQLAERELGVPPCSYAWMVAGSQARGEMHPFSDQDNALVLSREVQGEGREYFRRLGEWVCYGLAECGYQLCPGQMMASNPAWCMSLDAWLARYRMWIAKPETEALLHASVFLDLRAIYGDPSLVSRLQAGLGRLIGSHPRFLTVLVANSLRVNPPLGLFRQFVLARDGENRSTLNIKKQAINLVVELARVYALAAGSCASETAARLADAVAGDIISEGSRKELLEAFEFLNQVRFRHQIQSMRQGAAPSNGIAPTSLSQFERNHLKDAFRIIARTQEAAGQRFHTSGILR